ncbi:glycosyltransferase [Paraglaciecola aquimarina]|uniref:Glycosyltransferase n=1 Tax=Paraglaciecola aquimarina TaxID=1235557 RepID=A0ABU3T0V1_9ALTE|nr:glycosyltransferase [Paraglaciecola aquimarina]MDU0355906.1 glycosyltransferase [Paraglaciecola aquimarina]
MKWGTKYHANYVNTLYSMVSRHLSLPFRFVCLTDDNTNLRAEIESLPIPQLDIPNGPERGWDKLVTFSDPLYDLKGQALFLDLDVVIVDNIDCFFAHNAEFPIIKDWVKKDVTGNSSVYRFTIGKHPEILENFRQNHHTIRQQVRNEQEYLSQFMAKQGQLSYWPEHWCKSFKYNCIHKGLNAWFKVPNKPADCKIVVFHGNPNPPDAIFGQGGNGIEKYCPHLGWQNIGNNLRKRLCVNTYITF